MNKFEEAKEYLEIAVILMPSDPIVNDHFADCLWKNNQKIQARYYWNYVLKLETTDEKIKKNIENKLIFGLENIFAQKMNHNFLNHTVKLIYF